MTMNPALRAWIVSSAAHAEDHRRAVGIEREVRRLERRAERLERSASTLRYAASVLPKEAVDTNASID